MTILDFSVPLNFTVTVGGYSVTNAVTSLLLQHPLSDIYTPLIWTGQIELASLVDNSGFAESFDDLVNPSRWAPGQQAIVIGFGSTLQTVRIARNGYTYDESVVDGADVAIAQIQLTDILGLLDSYVPLTDSPGITIGADANWESVVAALLRQAATEAGISITLSLSSTGISDVFQGPRTIASGSYVKEAQALAGERGYWLWCDNEVIKWQQYPTNVPTPIYQKSRLNVELYKRQTGFEPPLNQLTISTAYQAHEPCQELYPKVYNEFGTRINNDTGLQEPYVKRRTTIARTIDEAANKITYTETVVATSINAFPPPYALSFVDLYSLYLISVTTTTEACEPTENKLVNRTSVADKALGLFTDFRDLLPISFWFLVLPECEKTVQVYTQGANGVLAQIQTDEYAPAFSLLTFNGVTSISQQSAATLRFSTIQEWIEECPGTYTERESRYRRTKSDSDSTLYDQIYLSGTSTPNTTPPEQPVRDATYPLVTVQVSGTVKQEYTAFSSFAQLQDTQTAETLVNQAGCERLAALKLRLGWSRYYSRYISHPFALTPTYAPFQAVHVFTGAFIRDGFKVTLGDGDGGLEAAIEYTGNYLGSITAVTEVPPSTPSTPAVIYGLIFPIIDSTFPTDTIALTDAPVSVTVSDRDWPVESILDYYVLDANDFVESVA